MNNIQQEYDWDFIDSKENYQFPIEFKPKHNENTDKFNIIRIASDALDTDSGSDVNVVKINENIVAIVPYVGSNHKPINEKTNRKAEWENQKVDRYRYLIATGLFLSIILHGIIRYANGYSIGNLLIQSANAQSSIKRDETPPAKLDNGVNAPNWSKINFSSMKFSEDGSVDFPNIKNPGMKEKRTWTTRQSLADVMELGDFEETEFKIQDLNLNQISKITGDSFKDLKLSDFELIQWQTLADLNAIVPNLSKLKVKSIPPIADFLKKALPGKNYSNSTIAQVLKKNPKLKKIELGKYIDTKKYKLNSIPNLDKTPIKKFTNWQNNTIAKIPGLSKVPFSEFPGIPVPDMSMVGKVDIVLKQVENQRWKSISGSYQEGFNVPCYNKQCAHIEVSGSNNLTGAAWMSGKYQKVKGGFGILGSLGGGKEPTGRHPFGKAFKQVLWEPNEAKGSITSMMFFRVCKRGFIDLGCSPYNIGPVPFFEYKETDAIILGTPLTVPKQATP